MPKIPDNDQMNYSTDPDRFIRKNEMPEQTELGTIVFYAVLTICVLISVYLRIVGM